MPPIGSKRPYDLMAGLRNQVEHKLMPSPDEALAHKARRLLEERQIRDQTKNQVESNRIPKEEPFAEGRPF